MESWWHVEAVGAGVAGDAGGLIRSRVGRVVACWRAYFSLALGGSGVQGVWGGVGLSIRVRAFCRVWGWKPWRQGERRWW